VIGSPVKKGEFNLIPFEVDETFMLKESGKNKGGVIDSFSRWRKKHRKKEQKNS